MPELREVSRERLRRLMREDDDPEQQSAERRAAQLRRAFPALSAPVGPLLRTAAPLPPLGGGPGLSPLTLALLGGLVLLLVWRGGR